MSSAQSSFEVLPATGSGRSFAAQVLAATFAIGEARVGAAWIGLLTIVAVFAPFLANSMPILVKMDGQWSSPMLRYLTPPDAILIAMFIAIVCVFLRRSMQMARKFQILLIVLAASIPLAFWLIHPPQTAVYDRYRLAEAEGRVQFILHAPIPYSPTDRLRDQNQAELLPPSLRHLMGTETFGADVLSRIVHATRIALSIGFISTGIAVIIGCVIGGLTGYFAGIVDLLGMRLMEIFDAIPTLFLLIAWVAFFGRNLYVIMAIIGLTGWVGHARFVRAEFLRLRNQDFVHAAVAAGLPLRSILFRHLLPNGISPVLVSASFGVAGAILAENTLSFLGIGVVDEPSWGEMLNQAIGQGGTFYWWIAIFPGAMIFLTVYAYNIVGEALRDSIDPRTRRMD